MNQSLCCKQLPYLAHLNKTLLKLYIISNVYLKCLYSYKKNKEIFILWKYSLILKEKAQFIICINCAYFYAFYTAANACSKSANKSSMCSIPTDNRTISSLTPAVLSSSSDS